MLRVTDVMILSQIMIGLYLNSTKNPEQKAVQALYTILEYFDAGSVENIKVRIEDAGGSILHVAVSVHA